MVVRLDTKYPNNLYARASIISHARRMVILYKPGVNEVQLDNYMRKTYHCSLKSMCLRLLLSCKVSTDTQGTVVTFADDNLNKIAELITHGNVSLYGSNILKDALC